MQEYKYLDQVVEAIGASTYQKDKLKIYVDDVLDYMVSAGIKPEKAMSEECIGLVARGLLDIWNYGSGETKLSPYFKERVSQKAIDSENEGEEDV